MLKTHFIIVWWGGKGGSYGIFSHTRAIEIINHPLSHKLLETGHKNTTKGRPKRK